MSGANAVVTWDTVKATAKRAGATYPELVAAQWALESDWGKATSGKNNYFGLKGAGTDCVTEEVVNGKRIVVTDGFIDFDSLEDCVTYLVDRWYKDWDGYKGVNNAGSRVDAAEELVAQGYATDPEYAEKLVCLMDEQETKAPEPVPSSGEVLKLEARVDTWLKKAPMQVEELADKQKVKVEAGKTYGVGSFIEVPGDAHAKVELLGDAGTWFIFEPHWRRLGELAGGEVPSSGEVDWSDFGCQVTQNLTVGEILQWDARRMPPENGAVRGRLLRTAREFQRIREAWGRSLGVTSFYRPEPINSAVGGVPNSRHVTGEAMDVYPTSDSLESFYAWIRTRWTGGLGDGRDKGFIHLDTRDGGGFVPGAGATPSVEWWY